MNVFGKTVKLLQCEAHGEVRLTTYANGKQGTQFHWNQRGADAVDALINDQPVKALSNGSDHSLLDRSNRKLAAEQYRDPEAAHVPFDFATVRR
jgi:hypothetical protein